MAQKVSDPITVMKRHELKYLLDGEKTAYLRRRLEGHMLPDAFGLTSIASLYYDTPDRRLIRASLEKPTFKEKLRLRSYGLAEEGSPVYLELKCKAFDTVYKRRVQSTLDGVQQFFEGGAPLGDGRQIAREIQAFRDFYGPSLKPAMFLSYEREAYYPTDGEDFRLTLDERILWRTDHMDLSAGCFGTPLLGPDQVLMELKTPGAMPLWMAELFEDIIPYQASFSKYGAAYRQLMAADNVMGGRRCA